MAIDYPIPQNYPIKHVAILGHDGIKYRYVDIDTNGNLKVRNLVWNTGTLAWEAEVAGSGSGSSAATAQYKISDMDDSADPAYFGFLDEDGNWYILRLTEAGEARYCAGTSGYTTAWTNRATQSYDLYSNVF